MEKKSLYSILINNAYYGRYFIHGVLKHTLKQARTYDKCHKIIIVEFSEDELKKFLKIRNNPRTIRRLNSEN